MQPMTAIAVDGVDLNRSGLWSGKQAIPFRASFTAPPISSRRPSRDHHGVDPDFRVCFALLDVQAMTLRITGVLMGLSALVLIAASRGVRKLSGPLWAVAVAASDCTAVSSAIIQRLPQPRGMAGLHPLQSTQAAMTFLPISFVSAVWSGQLRRWL
jgi:hypothetical protein